MDQVSLNGFVRVSTASREQKVAKNQSLSAQSYGVMVKIKSADEI